MNKKSFSLEPFLWFYLQRENKFHTSLLQNFFVVTYKCIYKYGQNILETAIIEQVAPNKLSL